MTEWKYYNHALIPTCAPHLSPDTTSLENGSLWKELRTQNKKPLLARWTTDFDCGEETNWWYVVKDRPFDISELKAKRRYDINKGIKNFEVRQINPVEFSEQLYEVQVAAFLAYPAKYRPTVVKEYFIDQLSAWTNVKVYGAFFRENGKLCGYAAVRCTAEYLNFTVQKTMPQYERYGINAALVHKLLEDQSVFLSNGGYICDGARSINHESAFQDYLEKYFGFRKAYCKLHVSYNPKIKPLIKLLYPFREILIKLDSTKLVHQINGVLKMEEIVRNGK